MQDVDRVSDVQALPEPSWYRRPSVHDEPLSIVLCAKQLHGIVGHIGWRWDLGKEATVRTSEP
jgi:hypothetical protein